MADNLEHELEFAVTLADVADAITLPHFIDRNFSVALKANDTEVTEIDRSTETALMDLVRAHRPQHGWYGEEHGKGGNSDAEWTWVIDPIDGTSNYVRGVPIWATLIALVHKEHGPVLGFVSAPALHSRWWGTVGGEALFNGHPISVSTVDSLAEASLSITENAPWRDLGYSEAIKSLKKSVKRVRGYGDFWQHMLVAQGALDIAVDAIGLEPYDIAALLPIVQAAGGTLTNRDGRQEWQSDTAITSNGLLHRHLGDLLRG